jgi:thiamine pyrophosphate-dependent acetolactate synthase large subunit-like protein
VRVVPTRSGRIVVLAGPGVIDDGAVDGLRTFAAAGGLGVANTWGAKGVFAWDSPHHLGTCGLQARDFELLGFADADLIVTTGLDTDESPMDRYALAPSDAVAPPDLAAVAGAYTATGEPLHNELYPRLAAIAQPGYTDDKVPLHPARAVADLGAMLPVGGLITADPGIAGLWVARTFPTPALEPGQPRRVVVPATRESGRAASLALEAARAGRPAIFVTTWPLDTPTEGVVEQARRASVNLTAVVWADHGAVRRADDHRAAIAAAVAAPGVATVTVPVAVDDTALLIEAAGEVVAWGGLTSPP